MSGMEKPPGNGEAGRDGCRAPALGWTQGRHLRFSLFPPGLPPASGRRPAAIGIEV